MSEKYTVTVQSNNMPLANYGNICENPTKAASLCWSHDGDSLRWNVGSRAHRLQALAPVLTAVLTPADPVEFAGNAREKHQHFPQYDAHRQGQGHHETWGQIETVGLLLEGSLPAKQQAVEGGDEQGNVSQSGLEQRQEYLWWHIK